MSGISIDFNLIEKSGGVNIVISSWTLVKLDHITNEIKGLIKISKLIK